MCGRRRRRRRNMCGSSRRDLHNTLLCTALQSLFFPKNLPEFWQNLSTFCWFLLILPKFCYISTKFHRNFTGISLEFEFPEFSPTSATSSSSAGSRKCPACADLASNCARPQAAALRDQGRLVERAHPRAEGVEVRLGQLPEQVRAGPEVLRVREPMFFLTPN